MRLAAALLILLAMAAAPGCGHADGDVQLTEADNGRTVTLQAGRTATVVLPAQLGTGFSWARTTPLRALADLGSSTGPAGGLPGGPQDQRFRFRATSAGEQILTFVYRRPWETGVAPAKTASFHIVVGGPSQTPAAYQTPMLQSKQRSCSWRTSPALHIWQVKAGRAEASPCRGAAGRAVRLERDLSSGAPSATFNAIESMRPSTAGRYNVQRSQGKATFKPAGLPVG